MNHKFVTVTVVGVAISFAMARVAAQRDKRLTNQTMANLSTAMHGESFAYAKYLLYAEHARKEGNTQLANLFEQTAKTERLEHFSVEAKLAGVVGSDIDNLRDSMRGEEYETTTMYREFARQAEKSGNHAAAMQFEEIRSDEMKHRDAFRAALGRLQGVRTARR